MEKIREQIEKIIKENGWNKMTSKEYEEFMKVTEIAKMVTFNEKTITGAEVNDILEKLGFCERIDKRVILTEKGKKYGRYVISIYLSTKSPIVTDKGYAKYKIEVVDIIEKFILENPDFILEKRLERKNKLIETKNKNKEEKENGKQE